MQRVTSILPSWDKTKSGSKKGFDKAWQWADKLGAPVNRLSNKIGSEAFWPTTLDKECDKAARILKSFCKDGFYAEDDRLQSVDVPRGKQRVLKKIPERVIKNAVGLAIFTTMRSGLWISGAGGSGILIARKEDGEWSPPSGILLHTAGLGFLVGIDIYDCVVVINNRKALDAFTKVRATLGGEISAVAGPVGIGGVLENDGKWKQANRPVFTYLKSRGFYAGVQVDGTVIIERSDENERFYGQKIGVQDILDGKARHPPYEIKMLMETVKAAEGRSDVDRAMMSQLSDELAPADVELQAPTTNPGPTFGIPEVDDPDPFGVLALEQAGLEIREAGTKIRPASTQFEYNPAPTSPIYTKFHRRSMDTLATRSNRESYMSTRSTLRTSIDRATQTTMEMGTQTDEILLTPNTSPSHSDENKRIVEEDEQPAVVSPEEIDYTKIDLGPYSSMNRSQEFDGTTVNNDSPTEHDEPHTATADTSFNSDDEDDDEEEPVIFEAAAAHTMIPQASARGVGLVDIPKRGPPPPLPPRNIARSSAMIDQASGRTPTTPTKSDFEEVDLHGTDRKSHDMESPKRKSLMEQIGALKVEEDPTPDVEEHIVEDMSKHEAAAPVFLKPTEGNEKDDFHSVPTSPNEQTIEVK